MTTATACLLSLLAGAALSGYTTWRHMATRAVRRAAFVAHVREIQRRGVR